MKINMKHTQQVLDLLDMENGRAATHTFTPQDIERLADRILNHLSRFLPTQNLRKGVTGVATSGAQLHRAYVGTRRINRVEFQVGSSGSDVFITTLTCVDWGRHAGKVEFNFTPEQVEDIQKQALAESSKFEV